GRGRRPRGPLTEPRPAQEEGGVARPRVTRKLFHEALEHAAGQRVETILEGLLTDEVDTIGLVDGVRGRGGGDDGRESREEHDGDRAGTSHTDTVRLPRPSISAYLLRAAAKIERACRSGAGGGGGGGGTTAGEREPRERAPRA